MSNVTFPGRRVGDFTITAISDGYLTASLDFLSNIDATDAAGMQRAAGQQQPSAVHINCYVVRGAGARFSSMPERAASRNGVAACTAICGSPVSILPRSTPSCSPTPIPTTSAGW